MSTRANGIAQPPRMPVRRAKLSELHADPGNVRSHSDWNLDAISDSLKSFGQVEPLVVQKSTGRVIGGNGRLEVMRRAGVTECDIVEVDIDDKPALAISLSALVFGCAGIRDPMPPCKSATYSGRGPESQTRVSLFASI
jgi:hypothetical protein